MLTLSNKLVIDQLCTTKNTNIIIIITLHGAGRSKLAQFQFQAIASNHSPPKVKKVGG